MTRSSKRVASANRSLTDVTILLARLRTDAIRDMCRCGAVRHASDDIEIQLKWANYGRQCTVAQYRLLPASRKPFFGSDREPDVADGDAPNPYTEVQVEGGEAGAGARGVCSPAAGIQPAWPAIGRIGSVARRVRTETDQADRASRDVLSKFC